MNIKRTCPTSRRSTRWHYSTTLTIAVVLAFLVGCKREPALSSNKPRVVASFFPLYDFTRELGGTNFEVVCLTPPGGDPHAMDANPRAVQTVAEANLVLLLGLGLDGWVGKLAASERKARIAVASLGIAPKRVGKSALAEFASHDHDGHAHNAGDDGSVFLLGDGALGLVADGGQLAQRREGTVLDGCVPTGAGVALFGPHQFGHDEFPIAGGGGGIPGLPVDAGQLEAEGGGGVGFIARGDEAVGLTLVAGVQ